MTRNAKDLLGVCSSCKEWTTVHEACCGSPVYVEGGSYDPDDYCATCGEELDTEHRCTLTTKQDMR